MSVAGLVFFLLCAVTVVHVGRARMEHRQIRSYRQLCPPGCTSCSAINGCITCQPNLFLLLVRSGMRQQGLCVHSCPDGFYGVRRQNYSICYKCQIENCETCFGQGFCKRCKEPYLYYRGQCIDRCPDGMHYANFSKDCRPTVDCMTGPWGPWSPCTRNGQNCGYRYGMISRTREVLESPSPNGVRCPSLVETRCCLMEMRRCVGSDFTTSIFDTMDSTENVSNTLLQCSNEHD
ncbi:R-spondin-3-like isoform X2 [Crassostrea virginica]|uniref:R-spondin-3-like isoform X2 n=1 Tax=Crassostrea virginica TaxID=6565 RepID=A0A8B8CDF9_CRAVI|nr:R-spondin-3-like isoform X2 [Crassostrea virginica]XP_022313199.1 R-spondin-3-like isoform X2 [Crassostrea virginica]